MSLDLKKLERVSGSKVTFSNNFHGIRYMNRDVNDLYIDTVIKSYDFDPLTSSEELYVIGVITEVRTNSYVIEVLEDSWSEDKGHSRVGEENIVPKPKYMMRDFKNRIVIAEEYTLH
jgi:hypothetical protein